MYSTAKAIGEVLPGFRLVRVVKLVSLQCQVTRGGHKRSVDPEVERAVLVISRNRFLTNQIFIELSFKIYLR